MNEFAAVSSLIQQAWDILSLIIFWFLDSSITKDNPAFSMINESDEDVIYGSDEESRRPLTRPPRNTDDSDWEEKGDK